MDRVAESSRVIGFCHVEIVDDIDFESADGRVSGFVLSDVSYSVFPERMPFVSSTWARRTLSLNCPAGRIRCGFRSIAVAADDLRWDLVLVDCGAAPDRPEKPSGQTHMYPAPFWRTAGIVADGTLAAQDTVLPAVDDWPASSMKVGWHSKKKLDL